jgi:hypothetical protein
MEKMEKLNLYIYQMKFFGDKKNNSAMALVTVGLTL